MVVVVVVVARGYDNQHCTKNADAEKYIIEAHTDLCVICSVSKISPILKNIIFFCHYSAATAQKN